MGPISYSKSFLRRSCARRRNGAITDGWWAFAQFDFATIRSGYKRAIARSRCSSALHVRREDDRSCGVSRSACRHGFFTVEPETAGAPVAAQSTGDVEFRFDGWLGDDMVRAHPALLVRTQVKNALLRLDRPSGFNVTKARVRTSRSSGSRTQASGYLASGPST
jgi:hypothetical protein